MNIPDNIPRDLLDKTRCVVVIPSVLKAAFVVGADYGRLELWFAAQDGTFRSPQGHSGNVRIGGRQLRFSDRWQSN